MTFARKSLLVLVVIATIAFVSSCSNKRVKRAESTEQAVSSQPGADGKPKIVALQQAHNFGKVKQGTLLEHIFRIRNQGDQQLVIERASGS